MYGDATSPTNQFGSQAREAWAAGVTGSKKVYVGVIDEGIDVSHPDLAANMWLNPFDPIDGIDNDGNGYVDDVNGWDFHNNDRTVYDGGNGDKHGTHVAGTIGAERNGVGVVGVAWDVTMISAKFLGPNGGYTSNAIKAVNYLTDLKTRHGLDVVATNNSWGGGGYSQALHDAIIRGAKANILFIAAAGNNGTDNDSTVRYPSAYDTTIRTSTQSAATYDAVIAVAAITSSGGLASWSNFGAKNVDLGAPGAGITSTLPKNSYGTYSGTSMATPHVAGAAVVLAAGSGAPRGSGLRSALFAATTPTASLTGKTVTGARLDLSGATATATTTTTTTAPTTTTTSPTTTTSTTTTTTTSPTTTTAPPAAGPTSVVVSRIGYRFYGGKNNNHHLEISVSVTDDLGAPLSGASVAIDLYRNGSRLASGTGTTNTQGVAVFTRNNAATGCYTTDVTGVVSGSLTFDGLEPSNQTCK